MRNGSNPTSDQEIQYCILGSGSSANSYYFRQGDFAFVIDNGYPLKQWQKRAQKACLDTSIIKFIFLTHAHSDHTKGVGDLAAFLEVPVVLHHTLLVDKVLGRKDLDILTIESDKSYQFGALSFLAFDLHHDAPSAISFHFRLGDSRFTLLTDTGHVDEKMIKLASRSNFVFLESNYCPQMLETGPYPPYLKKRIRGNRGHLSNLQAKELILDLTALASSPLERIYLVHLSQTNNHVDQIEQLLSDLSDRSFDLIICPKNAMVTMDNQFFFQKEKEMGRILHKTKQVKSFSPN